MAFSRGKPVLWKAIMTSTWGHCCTGESQIIVSSNGTTVKLCTCVKRSNMRCIVLDRSFFAMQQMPSVMVGASNGSGVLNRESPKIDSAEFTKLSMGWNPSVNELKLSDLGMDMCVCRYFKE